MYEQYFELSRPPFGTTPDADSFFPAPGHQDALALLQASIQSGDGISVLLGDVGIGKTLLCRLVLQSLDPSCSAVFLTNSHMPCVPSMLQAILYDLSFAYEELSEQDLRLRLTDFIMERFAQGGKTLLVVDEAQNLSSAQLEELRLMTNLEGRSEKAVQVLLCAQPRLAETLCLPESYAFRQRIAVVTQVPSLDADQTMEYVRAKISLAGGSADSIFTAVALSEIIDVSGGNPRRINLLCHGALRRAFRNQSGTVDAQDVEVAYRQLCLPGHEVHAGSYSTGRTELCSTDQPMDDAAPDREATTVVEVGAGCADGNADARALTDVPESQTVIDPEPEGPVPRTSRVTSEPAAAISRLQKLYSR